MSADRALPPELEMGLLAVAILQKMVDLLGPSFADRLKAYPEVKAAVEAKTAPPVTEWWAESLG